MDEVILLVYRAPHSYTREDVVEIQGHGGRVSAKRILRAVLDAGARPAEPGEFTKRAFLNGRIDLLQAEAVADLITAQSDRAAASAIEQMEGRLSVVIADLYDGMLDVAVDLEATLDFPEEELPPETLAAVTERCRKVIRELQAVLATWEEGHLLREGALVVIAGKPNVGKSTLLNTLLGKDRAIVTDVPGTTRDTLEERFVIEGIPVRLVDTAGLRRSECEVEKHGIRRAHESVEKADIVVYVIDSSQPIDPEDVDKVHEMGAERCIVVLNKTDLGVAVDPRAFSAAPAILCSLLKGDGIAEVRSAIARRLACPENDQPHAVISERHRAMLQDAGDKATETLRLLEANRDDMVAVAATSIRSALDSLGSLTGRQYSNEVLSNIFRRFCIGK